VTRIKIEQLIWDEYNREHIKKYKVTIEEVEETLNNLLVHKRGMK